MISTVQINDQGSNNVILQYHDFEERSKYNYCNTNTMITVNCRARETVDAIIDRTLRFDAQIVCERFHSARE